MTEGDRSLAVGRAYHNAKRLQHLTSDVLDSATIEAGQLSYQTEVLDLREAVDDAVEAARIGNTDRRFEVTRPDAPVLVEGDPVRLRQVVTNLLDNAIKSSPADSAVAVEVAHEGDLASVAVRDHGAGVAVEDRDRIFEKFHRGKGLATRGSGLGLYIARQVVDAHGGRIWVEDPEGSGAALVFSLPTTSPHALDARRA
jgi:signal transduction histidine kinase